MDFDSAHVGHFENDLAVVEQQERAGIHVLRQLLVVEADALAVADLGRGIEHEMLALLERDLAFLELADADLRPLQIAEDRHGATGLGGELLDERGAPCMVGGDAVREVEPHHVDAGADHALEDNGLGGRGTEGRDDLRAAQHMRANVAEARRGKSPARRARRASRRRARRLRARRAPRASRASAPCR